MARGHIVKVYIFTTPNNCDIRWRGNGFANGLHRLSDNIIAPLLRHHNDNGSFYVFIQYIQKKKNQIMGIYIKTSLESLFLKCWTASLIRYKLIPWKPKLKTFCTEKGVYRKHINFFYFMHYIETRIII